MDMGNKPNYLAISKQLDIWEQAAEIRETLAHCGLCRLLPVPTPRYEDEINKRTSAENDFVVLKKVKMEASGKKLPGSLPIGSGSWLEC